MAFSPVGVLAHDPEIVGCVPTAFGERNDVVNFVCLRVEFLARSSFPFFNGSASPCLGNSSGSLPLPPYEDRSSEADCQILKPPAPKSRYSCERQDERDAEKKDQEFRDVPPDPMTFSIGVSRYRDHDSAQKKERDYISEGRFGHSSILTDTPTVSTVD